LPDKTGIYLANDEYSNTSKKASRMCVHLFAGHFQKKNEKGLHRENNGILGSQHIDRPVGFLTIKTTFFS